MVVGNGPSLKVFILVNTVTHPTLSCVEVEVVVEVLTISNKMKKQLKNFMMIS